MDDRKFTWDRENMDPEIYKNGIIFAWLDAGRPAIDAFVEALSRKIGHKCDWSYVGGRAHLDVMPDGFDAAQAAMRDRNWMDQFMNPVTDRTFADKTWFTGWTLTLREGGLCEA